MQGSTEISVDRHGMSGIKFPTWLPYGSMSFTKINYSPSQQLQHSNNPSLLLLSIRFSSSLVAKKGFVPLGSGAFVLLYARAVGAGLHHTSDTARLAHGDLSFEMTVAGATTAAVATVSYTPPYKYVTSYPPAVQITGTVTGKQPILERASHVRTAAEAFDSHRRDQCVLFSEQERYEY